MKTTILGLAVVLCSTAAMSTAQQPNSPSASLDINGSSSGPSAPYAVTILIPGPLAVTVSGGPNMPFVVVRGAMNQVAARTFFGLGTLDVGPTQTVVVDGYNGPTSQQIFNTGMGSFGLMMAIPLGTTPTGTPFGAFQVAVVDFANAPFFISLSAASQMTLSANLPPIADAGTNLSTLTNTVVNLNGSLSSDPEGQPLSFSWMQTGGAGVMLAGSTTSSPSFTTPVGAGLTLANSVLTFNLVVNDGLQASVADSVTVTVNVSFAADVAPIFASGTGFNCVSCHGSSPSCSSGLCLDGTGGTIHANVVLRVNSTTPTNSLILRKPLALAGCGSATCGIAHSGGNTFFPSVTHPSYLSILTWIQQGAVNN